MEIELLLIYGQSGAADSKKKDATNLGWATYIPSKIFKIAHSEFYWQPILSAIKDVDVVIVEQANKLLVNYLLLLQNMMGFRKLAYWGHGRNFQATQSNQLSEKLKSLLATKVHWWFAYNEMSARVIREKEYPNERIILVQNALDTHSLTSALHNLTTIEIEKVRKELNIRGQNVGIYVGGLYPEKCILFLLEALQLIRQQVPDFEMIFIGGGIDAHLVEQASAQYTWIHYVGPKFDSDKIPYYAISKIFLMPSLIGLGIRLPKEPAPGSPIQAHVTTDRKACLWWSQTSVRTPCTDSADPSAYEPECCLFLFGLLQDNPCSGKIALVGSLTPRTIW